MLFLVFLFEFNVLSNKIPETKHSHLRNGSQLISQNADFCSVHLCLIKIIFWCPNSCKIMLVQLIFNQSDLFSICNKGSNTIKISFMEMRLTKIKLFPFNLLEIVVHTQKPISDSLETSLMQRVMVTSKQ